ncbi:hypothetical protein Hte_000294 [Hypoxylon texense]
MTDGVADCSNQAHIYVSSRRVNPPASDGLDHRTLADVKADGLKGGYTSLDQLKPLSETIFHELMHAVGGLENPKSGKKKITDNAAAPVVTGKIYGFKQCVELNRNRLFLIALGATPLRRAECPMILAKALYLQIKGKPTYWSTGAVDEDTLKPFGLPDQSSSSSIAITVSATEEKTDTAAVTVVRLADLQQCPASPKPTCSDDTCQGPAHICATQYRCGNESPIPDPGNPLRSTVLAGCRCCPLPIHVVCDNYDCRAPEGTRTCSSEELQGCSCQTWEDRRAAIAAAAAAAGNSTVHVPFGEEDEDLIEVYPDYPSDDENATTSASAPASQQPPMATMQPLQLLPLLDEWNMAIMFEKR